MIMTIVGAGLDTLLDYLSLHVLTCLVPAFFIAGAIAALLSKEVVLKYFGAKAKKWLSYSVASCSGTILAVCSCTVLPMFAGIYRRGAGIGPATAFLFSGPAINLLAIVLTARVLGLSIGIARAISAILMSVIIGLSMAVIFERGVKEEKGTKSVRGIATLNNPGSGRPWYITLLFFSLLVAILLVGASGLIAWLTKLILLSLMILGVTLILIFSYSREEVKEWAIETWWLAKRIFPLLLVGVFVIGLIGGLAAIYAPSHDPQIAVGELMKPYFGNNSFFSCFLSSVIGAILYMPTLLEVPIVGNLFGYTSGQMAAGPALSLLLSGPSLSFPCMVVIWRTIGWQKTSGYIALVLLFSTVIGMMYGSVVG
ncbi:MAG: permease [Methanophagales archaeon ANME-1-THS]|nr:MAG: permease [Methanophagales archaeon ANME-1-THS]